MDCLVPKLILQPLVENALYHGIKNRRSMGHIRIVSRREETGMSISVSDDGIGMSEDKLQQIRETLAQHTGNGFGVSNVQQRIQLYCGEAYGLSYESVSGEGTVVTVHLPCDLRPESTPDLSDASRKDEVNASCV